MTRKAGNISVRLRPTRNERNLVFYFWCENRYDKENAAVIL